MTHENVLTPKFYAWNNSTRQFPKLQQLFILFSDQDLVKITAFETPTINDSQPALNILFALLEQKLDLF